MRNQTWIFIVSWFSRSSIQYPQMKNKYCISYRWSVERSKKSRWQSQIPPLCISSMLHMGTGLLISFLQMSLSSYIFKKIKLGIKSLKTSYCKQSKKICYILAQYFCHLYPFVKNCSGLEKAIIYRFCERQLDNKMLPGIDNFFVWSRRDLHMLCFILFFSSETHKLTNDIIGI